MNVQRLRQEVAALRKHYPVWVSSDWSVVIVKLSYPTGWTPQTGLLRYEIPADYEASAPTVHLPEIMRHRNRKHVIRMRRSPVTGWKKWCVKFNDWNPRRHTLVTVTREMMGSLSDPSKDRLFRE